MVGVKGNSGKASSTKTFTEFIILAAFAIIFVAAIKTFATTGPWHAKATIEEHQGQLKVEQVRADNIGSGEKTVRDEQDQNLIEFVFGNLDGAEGNEGEHA